MKTASLLFSCLSFACTHEPPQASIEPPAAVREPASATPVLVELFTSEGCSSCPSADAAVRALAERPPPGARVIALELHVDYWNQLGHVDRFARPELTARQLAYQARFGDRGAYTPEAVVDGASGMVGSSRSALLAAVQDAARQPHARVGLSEAEAQVGALPAGVHDARLFVAEIDEEPSTHVTRGENAGLTLQHHWVVQRLDDLGPVPAAGGTFAVPQGRHPRVAFVAAADRVVGSGVR